MNNTLKLIVCSIIAAVILIIFCANIILYKNPNNKKNRFTIFISSIVFVIVIVSILMIGRIGSIRYYAKARKDIIYSENLNRKDLDLVISDYIKNNYFKSEVCNKKYEAHKIYGTHKIFTYEYVYLYTMFESYDGLRLASGGSNPLVVIVKKDSTGIYSVVNHKEPLDGDYASSLKKIFPHKYLKILNEKESETQKELEEKINSQISNIKKFPKP